MWVRSQQGRVRRGSLCPRSEFFDHGCKKEKRMLVSVYWHEYEHVGLCYHDAPWCSVGCYASFGRWALVLCWLTPFLMPQWQPLDARPSSQHPLSLFVYESNCMIRPWLGWILKPVYLRCTRFANVNVSILTSSRTPDPPLLWCHGDSKSTILLLVSITQLSPPQANYPLGFNLPYLIL